MIMRPSEHQRTIIDEVIHSSNNILVQACAGAGKTTTLRMVCEAIRQHFPRATTLVVAFNKAIAAELQRKMPSGIACSTMHSHGFAAIRAVEKGVRVENRKLVNICDSILCDMPPDERRIVTNDLRKIVPVVQATLIDSHDVTAVQAAVQRVGSEIDSERSLGFVAAAVEAMNAMRGFITFDEMISRPISHGYQPAQFDFVLVDETQDLNEAQQELIARSIKPGGRIIAVGDRWQSIYGFRGADPMAMETMRERFAMQELRLPVTYRCPQKIVELAQSVAGEETIQACENAPAGEVVRCPTRDAISAAQDGDMVLCRTNAPLMAHALSLVRQGRKAVVRGRDIGRELSTIVQRMRASGIDELHEKLRTFTDKKMAEAMAKDSESAAQAAEDRMNTIYAVMENCNTVEEVRTTLENIFSDDITGVVFSSIHRAKGLESERVTILRHDLLPHPMAMKSSNPEAAMAQEKNLQYVAYTRAMRVLLIAS